MKILLMSASYPPVQGGLQTATQALANEWQKVGHEVQVLTNRYPRGLMSREILNHISVQRELFLPIQVKFIKQGRIDLWLASLFYQPLVIFKLWLLMNRFQPDIINLHFPTDQVPFVLWLKKHFNFRLVISFHGYDVAEWLAADSQSVSESLQNDPKLANLRRLIKQAEAISACSEDLLIKAQRLDEVVIFKGVAIHNGVDWQLYQNQTAYSHPQPYILAYGRLEYEKGFDLLLNAFAQLIKLKPHLHLILAGDGSEQKKLAELIIRLGLGQQVTLFGAASRQQVAELLNGSLFVVMPSRAEPFGIVALEAMAAGKALLATKVGGLPEFVPTNNGNQLVGASVASLLAGMQTMLDSDMQKTGAQNRELAKPFSWQVTAQKYLTLFYKSEPTL